jgi:2'-5' RNA ligase
MVRAFLAIDLNDPALLSSLQAVQTRLMATGIRVKPTPPDQIHLTLKFFGEIREGEIRTIVECLAPLRHPPFMATLSGIGAFPSPTHARVIWVGFEPGAVKMLSELERKVSQLLVNRVGFDPKPFKPHVTIARVRQPAPTPPLVDLIREFEKREFGRVHISELKLKKSVLGPEGPTYSDLHTIRLGAAA